MVAIGEADLLNPSKIHPTPHVAVTTLTISCRQRFAVLPGPGPNGLALR